MVKSVQLYLHQSLPKQHHLQSRDSPRLQMKISLQPPLLCTNERLPEAFRKTKKYLLAKRKSLRRPCLHGRTSIGHESLDISIVFRWVTNGTNIIRHTTTMIILPQKLYKVTSSIYSIQMSSTKSKPQRIELNVKVVVSEENLLLQREKKIHV